MQVTQTLNEGLQRGYTLTLTADALEAKVAEKLIEAQPEVEMKGFRKGKVPMALLRKQFGERVLGEAMQESVDGAMRAHLEETGDRPAAQPEMKMTNENWKEGDDVEVTVSYECLPSIPEADYSSISLERMVVKAEEAAVDEALADLAKNAQNFEDRSEGGKAESGDQVIIDFLGKVDGEPFEGGQADDYPLVLGSNSFIPGFEDGLIGVQAGDERNVDVSFPDDYQAEHLAGKASVFECKIKAVKEPKEASIDDEMAKKFGAEDLSGLKAQISERLEAEYAGASRAIVKRGLLDALDGVVSFELPPSLVAAEADQIAHQLFHQENPDVEGHDHEKVEATDEQKQLAERRVKLGLFLADIGEKAEIKVTDAEMTQAVMAQARQYPGQEKQFFDFVQQNAQFRQQLQAPIFEDKVVDHVLEQVTISEKTVSQDELKAAIEALESEDA